MSNKYRISFVCLDCTVDLGDLRVHYVIHDIPSFVDYESKICPVCKSSFASNGKLMRHIGRCKTCSNIYHETIKIKQHEAYINAHNKYVADKQSHNI